MTLAISVFYCPGAAAQQDVNYSIHANIIYHFTKYIDWPEDRKSGNFIIGVIGDTPLFEELQASLANKKAGYQSIVIRKFSASAASYNCHILFISDEESRSLKKILAAIKGMPVLLVSETERFAQKGACINFAIVHEKLKLEINKNNIEQRDLSIASELLSLGILVK
ncbi:MAG TPA: YfiR family protein [Chitinophagaceae bacterium]|nr:YfiR family protein [Chitinophagaceae bacterium]